MIRVWREQGWALCFHAKGPWVLALLALYPVTKLFDIYRMVRAAWHYGVVVRW